MEKKKRFSFIIFVIGILVLVFGLVLILLKLINIDDRMQDGEYLIEKGEWVLSKTSLSSESEPTESDFVTNCESGSETTNCLEEAKVIWNFTEIGKGKLTTNAHLNDYDFIWAIEDNKLKMETSWLYPLENEFEYSLDQESGRLKLTNGEKTYFFTAVMNSENT